MTVSEVYWAAIGLVVARTKQKWCVNKTASPTRSRCSLKEGRKEWEEEKEGEREGEMEEEREKEKEEKRKEKKNVLLQ